MSADEFPLDSGLRRGRLGTAHLVFFTVAASAPLTVLGGGVTTMYAVSGNVGAALSYLLLAVVLGLFAVGYAAMSKYVANAGAFYAYIANGIGRSAGVAGSFIALAAYNAIQIGLYGLFGAIFGDFMATKFSVELDWWVWALVSWAVVGVLGLLQVDLNATVLAILLVLECVAVVIFDVVALGNPAGGSITLDGLAPGNLFAAGLGAVLALGIASFTGFESGAIYSEEVKDPRTTVARATYITVAFTGLFYAFSAWALTVSTGPQNAQAASAEAGPGVIFGALAEHAGTTVADIANVLFITSVLAALLSFHNGVARYLFALGRERVLPAFLGRAGRRTGAPVSGSLTQSVLAVVVVLAFAWAGRDPIIDLFTWFSGVSAVGVVLLMTLTSAAVVGYFRSRRSGPETAWQRVVAPVAATVSLLLILVVLVVNFDALLTPDTPPALRWLLPAIVLLAAAVGLAWGAVLRANHPEVYAGIGRGAIEEGLPEPSLHPTPAPAHPYPARR
ncbi:MULTISPECIES: APC family permease [Micromonospora]|uniref:Amino acid/polyamine/organocation transporter, APC superfamily n=1 Tax=Micromonospora yangpuensis TaxID=683228 RepID=A0A1C6UH90_9ACTN|nr:APC family permease [Micromonospora yangpuensis]GGM04250.1 amino acid permease [Micromonospora yangpuensis]SCL53341.1 amino acid/polyamine/organocation transporter, APC superfamily [Micromonospora yangpuensis]